jgi:hypothetical protein
MRYRGAAVVARVEKNESRKRPMEQLASVCKTRHKEYKPPMKVGIFFAVLVMMVPMRGQRGRSQYIFFKYSPTTTPQTPVKIDNLRPRQSAAQMNSAPVI